MQPRIRRIAPKIDNTPAPPEETRGLRRNSQEVRAARNATLLDNPTLRAVFDEVRGECIKDIETIDLDGSEEGKAAALEAVRALQALLKVKRAILRPLVSEQMKGANEAT